MIILSIIINTITSKSVTYDISMKNVLYYEWKHLLINLDKNQKKNLKKVLQIEKNYYIIFQNQPNIYGQNNNFFMKIHKIFQKKKYLI